jgi:predicted nucleotidyltransferase
MATQEGAVSPQDVRAFFEEKARKRKLLLDTRFAEAQSNFSHILEMIIKDYKPTRVWQWGSLMDRNRFSEISDIDIAVEGISSPPVFFEMYGKAAELTLFPLDLVDIDAVEPSHAESIRRRGKLVYGRD